MAGRKGVPGSGGIGSPRHLYLYVRFGGKVTRPLSIRMGKDSAKRLLLLLLLLLFSLFSLVVMIVVARLILFSQ